MKSIEGNYGCAALAPTNYAACVGTGKAADGTPGGSPWNGDGMFRAGVSTAFAEITDGLSNTAAFSESTLGDGPRTLPSAGVSVTGPIPGNPRTVWLYVAPPFNQAACDSGSGFWNNYDLRGFMWASGDLLSGSYNHSCPPNPPKYDCMSLLPSTAAPYQYTTVGYKAARSNHPGGVNLLLADGSVRFVLNGIQPGTWSALSTRAGGESISDPSY
jgi:prepilin-type processing-associated H-X9-DG protein